MSSLLSCGRIEPTRVTCSLKTYLEDTSQNQLSTRLVRASVIFLCALLIILVCVALSSLIPSIMALATSFTVMGLILFVMSLLGDVAIISYLTYSIVTSYRQNKRAFEIHKPARSVYYEGVRHWDLGRSSLGTGEIPIVRTLFSPFQNHGLNHALAAKIFLFMEHFSPEPPNEPLVDWACLIRDFRPHVSSLCFVIEKQGSSLRTKEGNTICEAFRSDYDAHFAMVDCYRLIHSKLIIEKMGLKNIDIIPSVMVRGDYPSRPGDGYREGLLRMYGGKGSL